MVKNFAYIVLYKTPFVSRYNQLRNFSEDLFESLPNLLSIDLQFNNIQTFSLKSFKHVSNASTPM